MEISVQDYKPEYVGRGQWHVLHTLAAHAKTMEEKYNVVWVMNTIVNNLRCLICYQHATEYLKDKWRPEYASDHQILFRFIYDFHAAANKHAGKTSPSFEEVQKFYYENNERCTLGCGDKVEEENFIR